MRLHRHRTAPTSAGASLRQPAAGGSASLTASLESSLAIANSNMLCFDTPLSDPPRVDPRVEMAERIKSFVGQESFPCVGARSAFNKGRARFGSYGSLGDDHHAEAICADLQAFSLAFPNPGDEPVTFVAMFDDVVLSEADFDRRLWQQLQALHEQDRIAFEWDASVASNPASPDFSFSVAGRAFFVVGLSPVASRLARRAPFPCLVFNFHNQFESLRASDRYSRMQRVIRDRDLALQGSINPVLARFHEASEARQYSGRAVSEDWHCPFHAMSPPDRS